MTADRRSDSPPPAPGSSQPASATDQWYFEIGDGQTYGPFTLEKLRKWAAAGNLMPTHRVRRADSTEWTIAAYVPGLELTTADTAAVARGRAGRGNSQQTRQPGPRAHAQERQGRAPRIKRKTSSRSATS